MNVDIFVVTHKLFKAPKDIVYKPIVAGAYEYRDSSFPESYLKDNNGDNISERHDLFSEFTVNYWIWKNVKSDIVGINHYRRYFISGGWLKYYFCLLYSSGLSKYFVLKEKEIIKIFNDGYNCILPRKQYRVERSLKEEYYSAYPPELLDTAADIIIRLYPEYEEILNQVLNSMENHQKCICIMKKDLFDQYSKWLFSITDELDKVSLIKEDRAYAYLLERLMNIWVEYNIVTGILRPKELFFVNTDFKYRKIVEYYTEIFFPKSIKWIIKKFIFLFKNKKK